MFDVSYIQGRSRLCKVILDKIVDVQQKKMLNGICVVGLYGIGGIGKTSICKILYNEFLTKFQGKICYVELERKNTKELLQVVLERLTNTNSKLLDGQNVDEMHNLLMRGIDKQPIFLALENISKTYASMKEVEFYLSQRFMPRSIMMVTTQSLDSLMYLKNLNRNNCLKMPELKIEEAKSLFIMSSNMVNKQTIELCVEKCHFQKRNNSYQYHPLAKDVLGRQLRDIDNWIDCKAQLEKIDKDLFNRSSENDHPIFSILRKSFDTLCVEDQLVFMDIALFLPKNSHEGYNVFKWLGMVHGIASVDRVMRKLEKLKKKSLLESLRGGFYTRIGMHDLWRAFCVVEAELGELQCRHWVSESKKRNELFETTPSGGIWQSVKRMAISELRGLERANFAHFPNVTVLKLLRQQSKQLLRQWSKQLVLSLSGLIRLKSLEVRGEFLSELVLQGLPRELVFLSLENLDPFIPGQEFGSVQQLIEQIVSLKELHFLQLINFGGSMLPNMRSMVSLQVAIFCGWHYVDTLPESSSNMQILDLQWCKRLRGRPSVGEFQSRGNSVPLNTISQLNLPNWSSFEALPDLGMFPALSRLDLSGCCSLTTLSSSVPLLALSELNLRGCSGLESLDLGMFQALPRLDLSGCCNLTTLSCSVPLLALSKLNLRGCSGLESLDLGMFQALPRLNLGECSSLTTLSSVPLLELSQLKLQDCICLKVLPELEFFQALAPRLGLYRCSGPLTALNSNVSWTALKELSLEYCKDLKALPDLGMFPALVLLNLYECSRLTALSSNVPLTALKILNLQNCIGLKVLPDLKMFPELRILQLYGCSGLMALKSSVTLATLAWLNVTRCRSLSWDGLDQLRASCPKVEIFELMYEESGRERGEENDEVFEELRRV